jgi:nitrate reductase cytochrome c-type subunit
MKRFLGWLLVPVIVLAFAIPMFAAAIPGLNATDKNPNGCVDCHKGDYSLANEIAKVKGHPKISKTTPKDCLVCHKSGSKNAFGPILHKAHLTGTDNHYMASYADSACTNCHKLDKNTGIWDNKGF